jgi:hypothetical protein
MTEFKLPATDADATRAVPAPRGACGHWACTSGATDGPWRRGESCGKTFAISGSTASMLRTYWAGAIPKSLASGYATF